MPDIDMDFSVERRDEVIDYVARKYGRDHVAQISRSARWRRGPRPETRLACSACPMRSATASPR